MDAPKKITKPVKTPFSHHKAAERALAKKLYRAHRLAEINPTFAIKHPDWCRDACKGHYTIMDKCVCDEHEKHLKNNITPLPALINQRYNRIVD